MIRSRYGPHSRRPISGPRLRNTLQGAAFRDAEGADTGCAQETARPQGVREAARPAPPAWSGVGL
jgi:hypothetical protein